MIVKRIKQLLTSNELEHEQDCDAVEVMDAVCDLLSELILKDDDQFNLLAEWELKVRSARCELIGHEYTHDHCGYWGHQYCVRCNCHMYPELGGLSCREAQIKTGGMTEAEYVMTKGQSNE